MLRVEIFANDLSIRRQFRDLPTFRAAIARLMAMRNAARRFDRNIHCHRTLVNVEPIPGMSMQQAVQHLAISDRRALMVWLTNEGPFWDDLQQHKGDDWLECRGEIVTDFAPGEAAYRTLHGIECGLASATPSSWDFSPIEVIWRRGEAEGLDARSATLENWRDAATLENWLQDAAPPIQSWADLQSFSTTQFRNLTFSDNCFEPLTGVPFVKSSADRILLLLDILDRFANAFDADGARTPEGHQIYQDYFTGIGNNAWFSDSSDSEKRHFRRKLTYPHPVDAKKSLFCTWHGKERRMTLRLHFSWPIQAGEPIYVVYAGPKLTKW